MFECLLLLQDRFVADRRKISAGSPICFCATAVVAESPVCLWKAAAAAGSPNYTFGVPTVAGSPFCLLVTMGVNGLLICYWVSFHMYPPHITAAEISPTGGGGGKEFSIIYTAAVVANTDIYDNKDAILLMCTFRLYLLAK